MKRNPSKKLVIGVAIDGSNISDRALETACGVYNLARGDRLVILHVADSTKTFLPRNLLPKHLESKYVDQAFSLRVSFWQWTCLSVSGQPGRQPSAAFCSLVAAWLVVGATKLSTTLAMPVADQPQP